MGEVRVFRNVLMIGAAAAAFLPSLAVAQAAGGEDEAPDEAIVVTGTLLRGVPPVGSNAISVGAAKIEETGATSSNELLASVPQVTNYFNRVPVSDLAIAVNQIQISRPNLRNISGNNAASSATLILVDGHRIATAGVNQASIDPDLIPTGAIERVEVVTEGGSATYGADAVAGVINFITRKRFDGLKVDGHYGIARDYHQWDASVTAGKDWGSGSLFASYSFTKNDALYGRDRGFIRNVDWASPNLTPRDRTCVAPNLAVNTVFVPANFTLSSVNYASPGLAPNTFNACDNSDDSAVVPRAKRHGAIVGLSQELDDTTSIDIRAYYGERKTNAPSVLTGTVNIAASNPLVASSLPAGVVLGGGVVATRAAVSFSGLPFYGQGSKYNKVSIAEWGANMELRKDISEDWQVRGLVNWSESDSSFHLRQLSPTRLTAAGSAATAATAINPLNLAATNPVLLNDLADSELAGQARDNLINLRAIAEGKLLDLPAGEVRLALGIEYMDDKLQKRSSPDVRMGGLSAVPYTVYSRNVKSAFGEVQAPIFGNYDGGPSLRVSASLRYDDYSDFGTTTNPKFGATFKPVDWVAIRGNWGTSFTAPTPLDMLGSLSNTISSFPFVAFLKPGDAAQPGAWTIALQGSQPGLKPQTADTWSVGIDVNPPFIPGFNASVSYYDVNFSNILRTPTPSAGIFTDFPDNVLSSTSGLTAAQLTNIGTLAPGGAAVVNPLIASGTKVYEFVDFRTGNFGILHVKGIDFAANWKIDTGFGSVDLGANGIYQLSRKGQASPTSAVTDELKDGTGKLNLQTTLGTTVGGFRAQATWNHSGGYPILNNALQSRVGSYDVINLFFKYDVPAESGVLRDLSFTLNVNNVADKNPPILRRNNQNDLGYANGFTLGRMFIFGASKKF